MAASNITPLSWYQTQQKRKFYFVSNSEKFKTFQDDKVQENAAQKNF